jgi:hypothetical protein
MKKLRVQKENVQMFGKNTRKFSYWIARLSHSFGIWANKLF